MHERPAPRHETLNIVQLMEHSKLSLARRLKLQQLAIFEQVVNTGSILAASRELHMTQPPDR